MTRKTRSVKEEIEATASETNEGYIKIHLFGDELEQLAGKTAQINGKTLKFPSVDSQKIGVRDFNLSLYELVFKDFRRHERTSRKLSYEEKTERLLKKTLEKADLTEAQRRKIKEALSVFGKD